MKRACDQNIGRQPVSERTFSLFNIKIVCLTSHSVNKRYVQMQRIYPFKYANNVDNCFLFLYDSVRIVRNFFAAQCILKLSVIFCFFALFKNTIEIYYMINGQLI